MKLKMMRMYGDKGNRDFDASWWCSSNINDEEEEDEGGEGYRDGDVIHVDYNTVEWDANRMQKATGRKLSEGRLAAIREKLVILFSNQRSLLGRMFGDGGLNTKKDDSRSGGGKKGARHLDLTGKGLILHSSHRQNFELSFACDLVGHFRRRILVFGIVETTRNQRVTTPPPPLPELRVVRISSDFFYRLGNPIGDEVDLRQMLLKCIAQLSHVEAFEIVAPPSRIFYPVPCPSIMPILRPDHQQRECRLEKLRLENLYFRTQEEIGHFADCFSERSSVRWVNLRSLGISKINVQPEWTGGICVDPIVRAVGGEVAGLSRDDSHLPRLETFVFDQRYAVGTTYPYRLDDDWAFARLLTKPSIKYIALTGFIRPRHCHLMERHLSTHPNIDRLLLSFMDDFFTAGNQSMAEEEEEGEEATASHDHPVQCLVRLVRANRNVREFNFMNNPPKSLDDQRWLGIRDILIWTAMNRNGLKYFEDPSSQRSFNRRRCVHFLSSLGRSGRQVFGTIDPPWSNETDAMCVEALFLSLRMRPDLCRRMEVRNTSAGH